MATPSPSRPADLPAAVGLHHPLAAERYYLLHRATQVVGAGLLALLATLTLSPVEAGLFFTLCSLLAAQVLLDAGSSTLLVAFLGRSMRQVEWRGGRLQGSPAALRRVGWLARYAMGWGLFSALLALVLIMPASLWLLGQRSEIDALPQWRLVTLATLAGLALSQLGNAVPVALEGLGQVARVARLRAGQDALAYAAAALAAASGHGLWSLAWMWGLRGAIGITWSLQAAAPLLAAGRSAAHRRHQRTLWPMQWRLACSWTAGYLSQQSLVPVAYALLGPQAAGRLGLAFFCTNGLLMVATAWASARMPEFARLSAGRRWSDFDTLLARVLRVTAAAALGGGLLAVVGLWLLQAAPAWAERLPAPGWFALLLLATVASAVVAAIATALRACGGEPFFVPTLVGGALVLPALALGAHVDGIMGLCVAYLGLCGGLGLPWALWLRKRQQRGRAA
ncbi:hypothetical protein ACS5PN_12010 [Roseateles sp. NT4]|uniref:hypothetical protein n=1 Tax=Roseateles sp. NT4 TaxID=3453715 RepID=UPI003EE97241